MKPSKYNSIINLQENLTIIYNSLSDKFLILKNAPTTIDGIMLWASPEIIKKFEDNKFLIDNEIDERKALENLIETIDNDSSFYHLHVNPTLNCNFKCWYCYENHIIGSKMSNEIVCRIIKHANEKIKSLSLNKFQLSFFGGEPLMYFESVAKVLIKTISKICSSHDVPFICQFTTNGALLSDKIRKFLMDYKVMFQITLDGHRDNHNKVRYSSTGGSYDIILENVKQLSLDGHKIILRVNYTDMNIQSIKYILEDLYKFPMESKANISIDFQRVWQDSDNNYDTDHYELIQNFMQSANNNGFNSTTPTIGLPVCHSCYGDKRNHILINYNGDTYFCTARDFKPEDRCGYINEIGEIVWIEDALDKWMNLKFKKMVCRNCRIAGICGGGCRQKSKETSNMDICPNGFSENDKDDLVLSRLDKILISSYQLK